MPTKRKAEEEPASGLKPLRKRALPDGEPSVKDEEQQGELPRKKVQVSSELLTLCLEGVKTELRDMQEKYETTCREHQAIVAEKDLQIATLEHRLLLAELSNRDAFYGHPAPAFTYSDEIEPPEYQAPRLCSRRGR